MSIRSRSLWIPRSCFLPSMEWSLTLCSVTRKHTPLLVSHPIDQLGSPSWSPRAGRLYGLLIHPASSLSSSLQSPVGWMDCLSASTTAAVCIGSCILTSTFAHAVQFHDIHSLFGNGFSVCIPAKLWPRFTASPKAKHSYFLHSRDSMETKPNSSNGVWQLAKRSFDGGGDACVGITKSFPGWNVFLELSRSGNGGISE